MKVNHTEEQLEVQSNTAPLTEKVVPTGEAVEMMNKVQACIMELSPITKQVEVR